MVVPMKINYILLFFTCWANVTYAHEFVSKILPISKTVQREMVEHKTYQPTCPVPPDRLREIIYSYYDFSGNIHDDGTLVVIDAVAEDVVKIFYNLYQIKFPINKSQRIEVYSGNDDLSMNDNNSSGFNCRAVTNKPGVYSLHSYGVAIDINPIQNPYVGKFDLKNSTATVLPSAGLNYINRANIRPGMLEQVTHIFRQHGFTMWGGDWDDRIDWQHFQTSRPAAKMLAAMQPNDAKNFFVMYAKNPKLFNTMPEDSEEFITLYQQSPDKFMLQLNVNFAKLNTLSSEEAILFFRAKLS